MECRLIVFSFTIPMVFGVDPSAVMKSFSTHIGNLVLECQDKMFFGPKVITEFLQFWDPGYVLTDRIQGCAVACVLKQLNVIKPGGELKPLNTEAFLKANGADDDMISKIKDLFSLCMDAALSTNIEDGCYFALEIAKCYRFGIFSMNWAPKNYLEEVTGIDTSKGRKKNANNDSIDDTFDNIYRKYFRSIF